MAHVHYFISWGPITPNFVNIRPSFVELSLGYNPEALKKETRLFFFGNSIKDISYQYENLKKSPLKLEMQKNLMQLVSLL